MGTVTVADWPCMTKADAGLIVPMAMPDEVRLKFFVAEVTPVPLAVIVIAWFSISAAVDAAWNTILPELPLPGCVIVAVTPVGRVLNASVTLPVKLVRVIGTVMVCVAPPRAILIA